MVQQNTKYFDIMKGSFHKPPSIVILGSSRSLYTAIIVHSYLNYVFDQLYGDKITVWEDRDLVSYIKYHRLLRMYHGKWSRFFRPTRVLKQEERFELGLRKLYDEFVLRKSNRHSESKKIVFIDHGLIMSDKPRDAMVEEILKYGGKKCNIQYLGEAIPGTGELSGDLLSKFDIKIATLPLGKKDSIALFGSDEYASKKEEDFVYFSFKGEVEKVPIFKHETTKDSDEDFIKLIKTWTF